MVAQQGRRTETRVLAVAVAGLMCCVAGCSAGRAGAEDARPAAVGTRSGAVSAGVLHRAAAALERAGSARARTSMEMATGGTRVTIRGEGVYDFRKRSGRLTVELPQDPAGAEEHRPITELLAPGALFMKNRGAGVPADKWVRVETATLTDGNLVTGGATDPFAAAELLRGARTATYVGRTEVAGVPVTHYRGIADLDLAARSASEEPGGAAGGGERVRHCGGAVRRLPRRRGTDPRAAEPVQLRGRSAPGQRRGRLDDPAGRLRGSGARTSSRARGHLRGEDRGAVGCGGPRGRRAWWRVWDGPAGSGPRAARGRCGSAVRPRGRHGVRRGWGLEMALPCHARCVDRSLL